MLCYAVLVWISQNNVSPEDEDRVFLRIVGIYLRVHTASQPRKTSQIYCFKRESRLKASRVQKKPNYSCKQTKFPCMQERKRNGYAQLKSCRSIQDEDCCLLGCSTVRLIALMMEAARTSETLVNFYQTTRCYNPDSNLHTHRRENLKSYLVFRISTEIVSEDLFHGRAQLLSTKHCITKFILGFQMFRPYRHK
jgi:hypothetical protein